MKPSIRYRKAVLLPLRLLELVVDRGGLDAARQERRLDRLGDRGRVLRILQSHVEGGRGQRRVDAVHGRLAGEEPVEARDLLVDDPDDRHLLDGAVRARELHRHRGEGRVAVLHPDQGEVGLTPAAETTLRDGPGVDDADVGLGLEGR
jgi:hypothetical protein